MLLQASIECTLTCNHFKTSKI